VVNPADCFDFIRRARHENYPVGLDALLFTMGQDALLLAALVAQHSPQAEAGRAALAKAQFDKAALTDEDLGRELAAILSSHGAFDPFDNRRYGAAVVLKPLSAVVYVDFCAAADVLVIGTLIGILEASPAAYVVNEDSAEVGVPTLDVLY